MRRRIHQLLFISAILTSSLLNAAEKPRLIVVISIDQFPYEYLERFSPWFAPGGFNRFMKDGANFENARYTYANTYTGPGHASIGTGYLPSESGIVANRWYDREKGKSVYVVEDSTVDPIVPKGKEDLASRLKMSPRNMAVDTLGDRLQKNISDAKVYSVAIKDRSAILMAGHKAGAAYWFDGRLPGFTSTRFYPKSDEALLNTFNATLPQYLLKTPEWKQSGLIPDVDLAKITRDPVWLRGTKSNRYELGTSFPHKIRNVDALTYTPFGNDIVFDFARTIIDSAALGSDASPDLLYIGLSSPDYLGHFFGPESLEVADTVVRTDRQLEAFLSWLTAKFPGEVTVALTADHGVQSIPEVARDMGRDAGRVDLDDAGALATRVADLPLARRQLEKLAFTTLERELTDESPIQRALITFFEEPAIWFDWSKVDRLKLDRERVKRAYRDSAKKLAGVAAAFTNTELRKANPKAGSIERAVRNSFRYDRSGDVLISLKSGWIWNYDGTGATHGQPVKADQHVPVMFWGAGIKAGTYTSPAAPTDIAKTLGAILGVEAGGAESVALPCVAVQR
ncbi:MAG TPA: alkaline phosphatase family protein [Thermoanaerobaculia bacterium]|nr:alkaline phosphatase family protein [Thermoanaerobaculia bacterium]